MTGMLAPVRHSTAARRPIAQAGPSPPLRGRRAWGPGSASRDHGVNVTVYEFVVLNPLPQGPATSRYQHWKIQVL